MKKLLVLLLSALLVFSMVGCTPKQQDDPKDLGDITIGFVPSKSEEEIKGAAEGLDQVFKTLLEEKGYKVGNVTITVGTSFNAVGEAMVSGEVEIGFLNTITYGTYGGDNVTVAVASVRAGVADAEGNLFPNNCDFMLYNNTPKTTDYAGMVTGYPGLIYVNIATEKGADLYAKAQAGTLTWEDVTTAKWEVPGTSSSSGYLYPSLWVNNTFGEGVGNERRTLASLPESSIAVVSDGYATLMKHLLSQGCDVICGYSDIRKDAQSTTDFEALKAEGYYSEYDDVWQFIKVIGASSYIMNDTVSVSTSKDAWNGHYTPEVLADVQDIFLNVFNGNPDYMKFFAPYSHKGYGVATDSDYDAIREVSKLFAE